MDTVIVIPCAGEVRVLDTVEAALAQVGPPRVILSGKAPQGLKEGDGLTILDTASVVPPGMARNLGVKKAGAFDVVVFLDADCVPHPGWLAALIMRIEEGRELVGGAIRLQEGGYFFMADQVTSFFDQLENTASATVLTLTGTNLAMTRRLWEAAGPFPPEASAGEDLEMVLRCRRSGTEPFLESTALVTHRPGPIGFRRMWRHAGHWGKEAIHVRLRYPDLLPLPAWMASPFTLAPAAPFVGAAFAFQQLRNTPQPYRRYRLWPAMALAKTVWCLAAAKSLWKRRHETPNPPSTSPDNS